MIPYLKALYHCRFYELCRVSVIVGDIKYLSGSIKMGQLMGCDFSFLKFAVLPGEILKGSEIQHFERLRKLVIWYVTSRL